MPRQTKFFFAEASKHFQVGEEAVEKAAQLRLKARDLQERVSRGGYGNGDLDQFWEIVTTAPKILMINTSDLSKQADLGSAYFASVAKEQRNPKLHNFLKAISAVITVADQRLADTDSFLPQGKSEWHTNPLLKNPVAMEEIQSKLIRLVEQLRSSNSISEIPEIDEHWRKTLISLLETVLSLLKSPMIEGTLFRKTSRKLQELSAKIGDDARTGFIGGLAGAASAGLLQILGITAA